MSLLKFLSRALSLLLTLFTSPLAFNIAGHNCGLAFTFFLSIYHSLAALPRYRKLLSFAEVISVPGLLVFCLSRFDGHSTRWWLAPWGYLLEHSTPVFTLLEGLCTLLVIQGISQFGRYLVKYRSENFLIGILIFSASGFTFSLYTVLQIYRYTQLSATTASLIGVSITLAVVLSVYGIMTNKGSIVESSLMFSYIVYSISMICRPNLPVFLPSTTSAILSSIVPPSLLISAVYRVSIVGIALRIVPMITRLRDHLDPAAAEESPFFQLATVISPVVQVVSYGNQLVSSPVLNVNSRAAQWFEVWRWITVFCTMGLWWLEMGHDDFE